VEVENGWIETVKTGRQDARHSVSDNARCCREASKQPVKPGQCCPAGGVALAAEPAAHRYSWSCERDLGADELLGVH